MLIEIEADAIQNKRSIQNNTNIIPKSKTVLKLRICMELRTYGKLSDVLIEIEADARQK